MMDFATYPRSLVAAYLSRQESVPARKADAAMQAVPLNGAYAHNEASAPSVATSPFPSDAASTAASVAAVSTTSAGEANRNGQHRLRRAACGQADAAKAHPGHGRVGRNTDDRRKCSARMGGSTKAARRLGGLANARTEG